MSDLTRDEFVAHMDPIRDSVQELVRLQREQNGRLGKAEVRLAVLEERSPSRTAALSGSLAATALAVVYEALQYVFGHR